MPGDGRTDGQRHRRKTDGLLLECTCCHKMKPRGAFRNRVAKGQLGGWPEKASWCRTCEKPSSAARRARRRAREKGAKGSYTEADVRELMYRQRGHCACGCGASLIVKGYHVDHIHPLSKGGANSVDNLQLLTPECNLRKADKLTRFARTEEPCSNSSSSVQPVPLPA